MWEGQGEGNDRTPPPKDAPQAQEDDQEWEPVLSNNARKKLRAQVEKQAAQLGVTLVDSRVAAEQANASTMEGPKSVRYTPTPQETLGTPPKVSIPAFGIVTLTVMKEPKKAFVFPSELKWPKTAEESVAEHRLCANSVKLADARERETEYAQSLQALAQRPRKDPAREAMTKKLMADVKDEITMLSKHNAGTTAIEGMKKTLQDLTLAESTRVNDAATANSKMKEKITTMETEFDEQIAELRKRKQIFLDCKKEVTDAWTHDESVRTVRFQEICAAWQESIKEASARATQELAGAIEVDEEPAAGSSTEDDAKAAAELKEAEKEADRNRIAMESMESDYLLVAPWSPLDLPDVTKPSDQEQQYWMELASRVGEWSEQHACAPCTFQQLIGPGEPKVLMESMAKLLGREFLTAMYGDRLVKEHHIVPRHLGFVLYNALQKPYAAAHKKLGEDSAKKARDVAKAGIKEAIAKTKEDKVVLKKKLVLRTAK